VLPQREAIIWVAGNQDPTLGNAAERFARLPANRLKQFVQVSWSHRDTPAAAGASAVMEWLQTLPAR
jgi:hypothetical protein